MSELTIIDVVAGALIGACLASWASAVLYRLPRRMDIISARSQCPRCGTELSAVDNIPIIGWLARRGRCRACAGAISPRYLMLELSGAGIGAALGWLGRPWLGAVALTVLIVPLAIAPFRRPRSAS